MVGMPALLMLLPLLVSAILSFALVKPITIVRLCTKHVATLTAMLTRRTSLLPYVSETLMSYLAGLGHTRVWAAPLYFSHDCAQY